MRAFERYSGYKPSGIEWIGDIPSHWEARKFKYSVWQKAIKSSAYEFKIGLENIQSKTSKFIPTDEDAFNEDGIVFKAGDVLFGKLRPYLVKVYIPEQKGICVSEFLVLSAQPELTNNKFIKYLMLSGDFIDVVNGSTYGSKMPRASWDFIGNLKIPLPPIEEQKQIADFLDIKSKQIDEFIADKQALIALFEEQKSAIINEAVTKGLDKTAPLKPSGIEWLGDIPLVWKIIRLKYLGKAIIGLTYDPKDITDEENGTLVLRSSNVQQGKIVFDDNVYVKTPIPEKLRVQKNDILICSRNGSRALIGKNAKIDSNSEGLTFGAFMTIFRSEFNDFLFFIFRSSLFEFQSSAFLTSTVNQLTVGALNSFEVPLPPLEEQKQIVEYLEKELSKIDTLIETAKAEITLIEEYKTSLINEAVTGKIKIYNGANT